MATAPSTLLCGYKTTTLLHRLDAVITGKSGIARKRRDTCMHMQTRYSTAYAYMRHYVHMHIKIRCICACRCGGLKYCRPNRHAQNSMSDLAVKEKIAATAGRPGKYDGVILVSWYIISGQLCTRYSIFLAVMMLTSKRDRSPHPPPRMCIHAWYTAVINTTRGSGYIFGDRK